MKMIRSKKRRRGRTNAMIVRGKVRKERSIAIAIRWVINII